MTVQTGNVFMMLVVRIDELTDTVSSYTIFCVDLVIPTKKVVINPNNKPWVTKELNVVIAGIHQPSYL